MHTVKTTRLRDAFSFREVEFFEVHTSVITRKFDDEKSFETYEPEIAPLDVIEGMVREVGVVKKWEVIRCTRTLRAVARALVVRKKDGEVRQFLLESDQFDNYLMASVERAISALQF